MTRRKLVALVAAIVLLSIGLVVIGTGLFLTRTDVGRAKVRDIALPYLQKKWPNAKIYVGKVSGSLIGGIVIDSIAIRDSRNELFASTGRIALEWNWRDLIDYRVYVTRATVEHPYVHIIQHENGRWNFKEIFASAAPKQPPAPKVAGTRGWGDYVVLDSVSARNTTFILTLPWSPDDSLRGAKRDSAIAAHVNNPAKAVTPRYDGFGRNYVWNNGHGLISHVRISDPDSNRFGKAFKIATLSVDEYVPTFKFRNLQGDVRVLGDSVWMDIPHFELPASVAHGRGKLWWGSDLPIRYDIAVRGDSVALDDVNWVYPQLPRTGGGSLDLAIRNDPKNLHVVDFQLKNMDMRTTGSHLTGEMWFGIGAPVLLVRNVNLKADPVTFDFIRTLNGKPFPYDWRGDIFGSARGRGGPLTRFVVDDARGYFRDAHVPGAVSRFAGRGELDILYPAFTTFHHFDVNAEVIDLRTIEYLNKNFPRLGGTVSGTATLDSVWTDVRFSNANLTHQDGPGEPSRVSGSGRVTTAAEMVYDLTLDAQPLNATMLARSKPFEALPIRGLFSGPLRVQGTASDLAISTTLQSAAGSFSFEGRADVDSIGGYGAHGRGQFANLNLAGLLEKETLPQIGLLNGHYDVALDSIEATPSSIRGTAEVTFDRTIVDSIRVYPSQLRVRFADGRMVIDSARIRTDAFVAELHGGVGLPQGQPDSLFFNIRVDSLGGLRPLISHPVPAPGALVAEPDSLSGSAAISGVARGTLDALALTGDVSGDRLYFNKDRGDTLIAHFDLQNAASSARTGTVAARIDSVTFAGIALDTVGGVLHLGDSTHRTFEVGARSRNGPTAVAGGRWADSAAVQVIFVDSLQLAVGEDRWRLTSPARVRIDSSAIRVDSLLIRNSDSAFVAIMADVPAAGAAFAQLQARWIPLVDVGTIAQLSNPLHGVAGASIVATGTKMQPVISAQTRLAGIQSRQFPLDSVRATASYDRRRLIADATAVSNGAAAFTAHVSWPFDISLFSAKQLNDSIDARISTTSTDLGLVAALSGLLSPRDTVRGRLSGFLSIGGTTAAKVYRDSIRVVNGEAVIAAGGVKFTGINGTISGGVGVTGVDSTQIALTIRSNSHDSASVSGWVSNLARLKSEPTRFDLTLRADTLHAFNRRTVAEVYFSTPEPLRLRGSLDAPVLTGRINIDRGAIFLSDPDLARKLAVETLAELGNSSITSTSALMTRFMTNLRIQSVPVTLGEDVRLRSSEVDVRLAGQLELVKSNASTRLVSPSGEFVPGLTLTGTLHTTGGTYTLKFGNVPARDFAVLPNGTVNFDGTSPETPLVDIKAQYNVKRLHDRDLAVIVNLTGRLPNPQIRFTSDNDYPLADSDLLSYLIIGQPGFDFGSGTAISALSPTVSAVLNNAVRGTALGSYVSSFQLELGATDNSQTVTNNQGFYEYLRTATLDFGVPVYKNVFLGLNAGYCQIVAGQLSGVGAKVEYRFRPDMSLQAAFDPAAVDTRQGCNERTSVGLFPSPSQFSFSVRKTWRF